MPCRGAASPLSWSVPVAGSPPLRRGVLPPLVLGFALPPFAPPSRGVGALCGAGSPWRPARGVAGSPWGRSPCGLRGGGRSVRRGYAGACAPAFCAPPRRCFAACARAAMPVGVGRGCSSAALAGGVVFRVWGLCRCGRARGSCAPRTPSARGGVCAPIPPAPFPVGKGGRKADGLPCGGYHGGAGLSRASGLAPGLAPP